MNERIREIAEQAGFFPQRNWDHTGWHAAGHNDKFEMFVKLIVQECIAQCWTVSELEHKGEVISECSKRMRKHFGVE